MTVLNIVRVSISINTAKKYDESAEDDNFQRCSVQQKKQKVTSNIKPNEKLKDRKFVEKIGSFCVRVAC